MIPTLVLVIGVVLELVLKPDAWAGWGQWAGAVGAVAAVVAALQIAGEERREQQIAQARQVTATIEWPDDDEPYPDLPPLVDMTNHSDRPILDPKLDGFVVNGKLLPDSAWRLDIGDNDYGAYWGPSQVVKAGTLERLPFRLLQPVEHPVRLVPVYSFTDCNGRRWQRRAGQTPVAVPDLAPPAPVTFSWPESIESPPAAQEPQQAEDQSKS